MARRPVAREIHRDVTNTLIFLAKITLESESNTFRAFCKIWRSSSDDDTKMLTIPGTGSSSMTASSSIYKKSRSLSLTSSSDKSAIADDFVLFTFGDANTFPNSEEDDVPPELDDWFLIRDEITLERF